MNTLLLAAAFFAQAAAPVPAPSPGEIAAAAPASDWVAIEAKDLLVMELALDATGARRTVVIQLMPAPFSQGWIGNIRKFAAAKWWDGTSVNRVQDNYVVQWGDPTEKKALPNNLATVPVSQYEVPTDDAIEVTNSHAAGWQRPPGYAPDAYARWTGFVSGWPVGKYGGQHEIGRPVHWPVHCYGMVGVGRNLAPDTGSGAELYTVIGHAPRHLDRNIALVGRVIAGIEHLSSLPRGTGALGFYEKPEQRLAIRSIRLATDLPEAERPRFQYLSTESDSFARYADARANRRDPFFNVPAGGADICNIPVPIRVSPIPR